MQDNPKLLPARSPLPTDLQNLRLVYGEETCAVNGLEDFVFALALKKGSGTRIGEVDDLHFVRLATVGARSQD